MADLDYYYGHEAEQFVFFRIPKALFSDARFSGISTDAKVLYGLLLDRMGLSVKSGWMDNQDRVYLYYSLSETCETLGCKRDKAIKLYAELDAVGLIERKRQGLGKPHMIYVKNFASHRTDPQKSEKPTTFPPEDEKSNYKQSEKPTSGSRKNRSPEVGKTDANNTEYSKTDLNDTDSSSPLPSPHIRDRPDEDGIEKIREQIEYEYFQVEMPDKLPMIDCLVGIIFSLRNEATPQTQRLLCSIDSCVVLEFLDELKIMDLHKVRSLSAYLRKVFPNYLLKRAALLAAIA